MNRDFPQLESPEGVIWSAALLRGYHMFFHLEFNRIVDLIIARPIAWKKNKSGGNAPHSKEALSGAQQRRTYPVLPFLPAGSGYFESGTAGSERF